VTYPSGYLNPIAMTGNATTDTNTVQTAINTVAGTAPLVFPAGNWNLNALTMKPGTTFIGAGNVTEGATAPAGSYTQLSLNKGGSSHFINVPIGVQDITIRDMVLNGGLQANNPGCDVINVADNTSNPDQVNLRLERISLIQAGRYGLYVGVHRDDVKMHHSAILYSYGHGLLTKGPDGVYDACAFGSNGAPAVQAGASGNNIEIQAVVNRITNCDIWGGPGGTTTGTNIGIVVQPDITGVVISGNGIDRHNHEGIYVDAGCYSVSVFNNVFHSNSQLGNGMYAHCHNTSALAGAVSFDGNVAVVDGGLNTASYLLFSDNLGTALTGNCNYATVGTSGCGCTAGILHN
jgi:hypothetical protein